MRTRTIGFSRRLSFNFAAHDFSGDAPRRHEPNSMNTTVRSHEGDHVLDENGPSGLSPEVRLSRLAADDPLD